MDSKLKRYCILGSMGVILLAALLVLLANQGVQGPTGDQNNNQATAAPDSHGQEVFYDEYGQRIGNDLSAFLDDATFFNPEENTWLEERLEEQNRLSLLVTSVERDLRIQVVDYEGKPVTGQSFLVELEGQGEYKDLDQDGILYIGGISSGEYYVSLHEVEGYRVPVNPTRVQVKDKVEYVFIDDISLLIKTEEDIDAEAEDTGVQEADVDSDKTEIKKLQSATANAAVGIDVSKWNREIDWEKVRAAGVSFVIIRAGYRGSSTGSLVVDPYFEANIKGASMAGLNVGVYFFTQAVNEVEAVEEASMVLELVQDYSLDYPIFIDTEGAGGNGRADNLTVEERTLVCDAFCRTVENAGIEAGVYASRNWYHNRVEVSRLERYYIWLAEYRSVPLYDGYYHMWQYTSKGNIDGIEGNVDMNVSYMGR
ncbi:MAG: glycoside hydrolase family 25 protein [bacterium]|nr:glycoside hydrolase family 25 protein [bacterium]MCM1374928.1 glycoside hydrolase family 25 protein [Muribaculum sp.]